MVVNSCCYLALVVNCCCIVAYCHIELNCCGSFWLKMFKVNSRSLLVTLQTTNHVFQLSFLLFRRSANVHDVSFARTLGWWSSLKCWTCWLTIKRYNIPRCMLLPNNFALPNLISLLMSTVSYAAIVNGALVWAWCWWNGIAMHKIKSNGCGYLSIFSPAFKSELKIHGKHLSNDITDYHFAPIHTPSNWNYSILTFPINMLPSKKYFSFTPLLDFRK